MRLFLTMVLAIAIPAAPVLAFVVPIEDQCSSELPINGHPDEPAAQTATECVDEAAVGAGIVHPSLHPGDCPAHLPCDGCDCPASCCSGTVKAPVTPLYGPKVFLHEDRSASFAADEHLLHGSPHLQSLKRPPRITTFA